MVTCVKYYMPAKTLLDALRIPQFGQYNECDEDPLYCLMEDDKLISELHITADTLLADPQQVIEYPHLDVDGNPKISTNHVFTVINVQVKPTEITFGNLNFV